MAPGLNLTPGCIEVSRFTSGSHPRACEAIDVTFAINVGWARERDESARLVVARPSALQDVIYHPTPVGQDLFETQGN